MQQTCQVAGSTALVTVANSGIGKATMIILTEIGAGCPGCGRAEELTRIHGPAGGIDHAEARLDHSVRMLFDAREGWPETPAFLQLYVTDGHAVYKQAPEDETTGQALKGAGREAYGV